MDRSQKKAMGIKKKNSRIMYTIEVKTYQVREYVKYYICHNKQRNDKLQIQHSLRDRGR